MDKPILKFCPNEPDHKFGNMDCHLCEMYTSEFLSEMQLWLKRIRGKHQNASASATDKEGTEYWLTFTLPDTAGPEEEQYLKDYVSRKRPGLVSWEYCLEHTKKGTLHAHVHCKYNKPVRYAKLKERLCRYRYNINIQKVGVDNGISDYMSKEKNIVKVI